VPSAQNLNSIQVPYLISYYDGKISRSFFLTDYPSSYDMLEDCINSLLVPEYNGSDQTDTMLNSLNQTHNINIAIASSITALARVEMSKFKNNPNFSPRGDKLYYTDTDSILINFNTEQLNMIFPNIRSPWEKKD
jgi:hypothetical protein